MAPSNCQPESLAPLHAFLAGRHLVDLSAYNPAMLRRRLQLRLRMLSLPDLDAYLAYLGGHPEEITRLIDSLSISVSHFFRDRLPFALLRERVVPSLLDSAGGAGLRIWCAGCGQGEEAYSLAILVHEYCQDEAISPPVVILASDIDRKALDRAQRGWYQPAALNEVPKGYLDHYFIPEGDGYRLTAPLRAMVTFVHHDLSGGNPPPEGIFSDYQLVLCRNVLIYFNQERGALIQQQLVDLLRPGGWLVLGEAESLVPTLAPGMREVMPGAHIFRKEANHA